MTSAIPTRDLESMLSAKANRNVRVLKTSLVRDSAGLGGRSGSDTALVEVTTDHPASSTISLIIKTVPPRYAFEPNLYRELDRQGAPVATYYGHVSHSNGSSTMAIEYLPFSVDWPIPATYHISWARSAARLAACKVPEHVGLPDVAWTGRASEFIEELDEATRLDDDVLQTELAERGLRDIRPLTTDLDPLLAYGDTLEQALTQGELYGHHTGQRRPDGEVLFYDFNGARWGPRLWDLVAITIDHGEPYEAAIDDVIGAFSTEYELHTGQRLNGEELRLELSLTRALTSLVRIPPMAPWLRRLKEEGQDTGEYLTSPRKWIVLHLEALRDGLELLSRSLETT